MGCGQVRTDPRNSTRKVHLGYFATFHRLSGWLPVTHTPPVLWGCGRRGRSLPKPWQFSSPFLYPRTLRSPWASACNVPPVFISCAPGCLFLLPAFQLFYFHNYRSQSQALTAALQPCSRALSFVIDTKALDPSFLRAIISCWITAMARWGNLVCVIRLFLLLAVADHIRNGISGRWWAAARNWRVEKIQAGWRKGQGREWGQAGMESGKLGAGQTRLM